MSEPNEKRSELDVVLPNYKKWNSEAFYNYADQINDYEDLEGLSHAITQARIALFKVTDQINKYDRLAKGKKIEYERAYRREYLRSVERTENLKKARADLACENLENDYLVNEQLVSELIRLSNTLRLELQTLQAVGNNIRQQLKME